MYTRAFEGDAQVGGYVTVAGVAVNTQDILSQIPQRSEVPECSSDLFDVSWSRESWGSSLVWKLSSKS